MKRLLSLFAVAAFAACNNGVKVNVNVDSLSKKADNAVEMIENKLDSSETLDSIRAKGGRFVDSAKTKGGRLVNKAEGGLNDLRRRDTTQ